MRYGIDYGDLDKFGPEIKRAWVRVNVIWQVISFGITLVLIVPFIVLTIGWHQFVEERSQTSKREWEQLELEMQRYEENRGDPFYQATPYTEPESEPEPSTFPGVSGVLILITLAALLIRFTILMVVYARRRSRVRLRLNQSASPLIPWGPELQLEADWLTSRGFSSEVVITDNPECNAYFATPEIGHGGVSGLTRSKRIVITSGLKTLGLTGKELQAVLASGVARSAMPMRMNGDIAAFTFSVMSIYVAARSLPFTLFSPVRYGALFAITYSLALLGAQYLFIKWSTLIGNYLCLLSDSMAVSLTGEPRALASAISRVEAAGDGDEIPQMFKDSVFVPAESRGRLVPVPWSTPAPREAAELLRRSSSLVEARLLNLSAIARDYWPALGRYHPSVRLAETTARAPRFWRRLPEDIRKASVLPGDDETTIRCGKCGALNTVGAAYCELCLAPFDSNRQRPPAGRFSRARNS